jgi:hypothetical protein
MTSLQTDLNDHSLQKEFSDEGVKLSEKGKGAGMKGSQNEGERE